MRGFWTFQTAGQLVFGPGAVDQLGTLCARRGWRRVLVITDGNLARLGIVARVLRGLAGSGVTAAVFDGGQAEPTLQTAATALDAARQTAPEAILGLGGGSNLDLAKMTAIGLTHGGHPRDYFGYDKVPGPLLPLVCLPTTAGTGSEVSHSAVLTDPEEEIKVSTLSDYLRPTLAVVDPQLTCSCPPQVTADSGIDALTHAIEALTAMDYDQLDVRPDEATPYSGRFPLGACLAERAIALVGEFLERAVRDGTDQEARTGMALAATLAGIAFSNCGVALVHALEYPLGAALHCSHGAGNGLLLPYVMRFNLPRRTAELARVAELLGADLRGMSPEEAAQQAIVEVERLKLRIGIPARIGELGGRPDQLAGWADKAYAIDRLRRINPRPAERDELLQILQEAF